MHLATRVTSYVLITRPGICIGSVALVIFSTFAIDPDNFQMGKTLLAGIAVGLSSAAGSVINDVFDQKADVINNPHRVLPSGTMKGREALLYYFFLLVAAIILFANVNGIALAVGISCNAILFLYSWRLRKTWWWLSNVVVALMIAVLLSFGMFVAEEFNARILFLFFFWFLVSLAREILGDVTDMEGDKMIGLRTLPFVVGRMQAVVCAAVILFVAAMWSFTPFLVSAFDYWVYGLGVSVIYVISLHYVLPRLKKDNVRPVQDVLKAMLFLHLVLFALPIFLAA